MNVKVDVQLSEGVAALKIPRERLEAVANEIAEIGVTDPHWGKQPAYTVTIAYKWWAAPNIGVGTSLPPPGAVAITIGVSKKTHESSVDFEVLFMLSSEVEALGFRKE